jgi:hypothetical protein
MRAARVTAERRKWGGWATIDYGQTREAKQWERVKRRRSMCEFTTRGEVAGDALEEELTNAVHSRPVPVVEDE